MNREDFAQLKEVEAGSKVGFEKSELKAKVRILIKDDALSIDEITEDANVAIEMTAYEESGKKTKPINAIKSYLNSDMKKGLVIAKQEDNGTVRYIRVE